MGRPSPEPVFAGQIRRVVGLGSAAREVVGRKEARSAVAVETLGMSVPETGRTVVELDIVGEIVAGIAGETAEGIVEEID